MSATINPEWVKLLEQERDAFRVEYECRADWIAKMNAILGYDNPDGFHSEPDPFQIATELKRLADIGKRWETDSSLEKWFPFTADEFRRLKEEHKRMRAAIERVLDTYTEKDLGYFKDEHPGNVASEISVGEVLALLEAIGAPDGKICAS